MTQEQQQADSVAPPVSAPKHRRFVRYAVAAFRAFVRIIWGVLNIALIGALLFALIWGWTGDIPYFGPQIAALVAVIALLLVNVLPLRAQWKRLVDWYAEPAEPDTCATEQYKALVMPLVARLRKRARQKRFESLAALCLVLLSVVLAAFAFTRNEFVFSDPNNVGSWGRIAQDRALDVQEREQELQRLQRTLQNVESADERLDVEGQMDAVQGLLNSDRRNLEFLQGEMSEEQARADYETRARLFSSIAARIGIAVVLLLLVQILVGLYRYCSRLEAFYEARADAFSLAVLTGEERAADLASILMPDTIDFGKGPATPIDQATRAVSAIVRNVK